MESRLKNTQVLPDSGRASGAMRAIQEGRSRLRVTGDDI
jgi:hypothetical protein